MDSQLGCCHTRSAHRLLPPQLIRCCKYFRGRPTPFCVQLCVRIYARALVPHYGTVFVEVHAHRMFRFGLQDRIADESGATAVLNLQSGICFEALRVGGRREAMNANGFQNRVSFRPVWLCTRGEACYHANFTLQSEPMKCCAAA